MFPSISTSSPTGAASLSKKVVPLATESKVVVDADPISAKLLLSKLLGEESDKEEHELLTKLLEEAHEKRGTNLLFGWYVMFIVPI